MDEKSYYADETNSGFEKVKFGFFNILGPQRTNLIPSYDFASTILMSNLFSRYIIIKILSF